MPFTFDQHELADANDLLVVDAGIDQHNLKEPALACVRPLSVFARDRSGEVRGGAVGRTWGECCELQQLWVAESERGCGIGAALTQRFEAEAKQRGCRIVYLDTFTFQAPHFYEKQGYRVVLETRGFGKGIAKYTMQKTLHLAG